MAQSNKVLLYGSDGEVIGTVGAGMAEYEGSFIVQCPKHHLYLIHPDELRQPDPPECPVCNKQDAAEKDGD